MNNLRTPLVMSANKKTIDLTLAGLLSLKLRRTFPRECPKNVYFAQTGTAKGDRAATVRVRAKIDKCEFRDLNEIYAERREFYARIDKRHKKNPGYRFPLTIHDGKKNYHERLTWKQAFAYQGDRQGVYLLCLSNIVEAHFPLTEFGLDRTPQSYSRAKREPVITATEEPKSEGKLTEKDLADARYKVALFSFILQERRAQ